MNDRPVFENEQQALKTGMLIGLLMRHGIPHRMETNEDGYTPVVYITLEDGVGVAGPNQVGVQVLP